MILSEYEIFGTNTATSPIDHGFSFFQRSVHEAFFTRRILHSTGNAVVSFARQGPAFQFCTQASLCLSFSAPPLPFLFFSLCLGTTSLRRACQIRPPREFLPSDILRKCSRPAIGHCDGGSRRYPGLPRRKFSGKETTGCRAANYSGVSREDGARCRRRRRRRRLRWRWRREKSRNRARERVHSEEIVQRTEAVAVTATATAALEPRRKSRRANVVLNFDRKTAADFSGGWSIRLEPLPNRLSANKFPCQTSCGRTYEGTYEGAGGSVSRDKVGRCRGKVGRDTNLCPDKIKKKPSRA